jgi:hypothetical protein
MIQNPTPNARAEYNAGPSPGIRVVADTPVVRWGVDVKATPRMVTMRPPIATAPRTSPVATERMSVTAP